MADHLYDEPTKHWTGATQSLTSLIRIDGKAFRLMGTEPRDGLSTRTNEGGSTAHHNALSIRGSGHSGHADFPDAGLAGRPRYFVATGHVSDLERPSQAMRSRIKSKFISMPARTFA